jgi:hypothetical protein
MAGTQSGRTVVCVNADRLNVFGALPASDRPLTIRIATPEDADALRRLAELDSSAPISGRALLAELDGDLIAAASLENDAVIADPFTPSAYAVRLLTMRRHQLTRPGRRPSRDLWLRRRPAEA